MFSLSRGRTYIDQSFSVSVWVFQDRTYIDQWFSWQFEFSGPHPYQSTIFLSFPCQFEFFRAALLSIGHLLIISILVWVFRDAPISIGHFSWQFEFFGVAPISISHLPNVSLSVWVFQDYTYIDQSFFMTDWVFGAASILISHFPLISMSFWAFQDCTYIDWSSSVFNLSRGRTYINQPSSYHFYVSLSFSGPHLYRSVIHRFVSFN